MRYIACARPSVSRTMSKKPEKQKQRPSSVKASEQKTAAVLTWFFAPFVSFTVIDTFSPLSWSLEEATCENVIEARRPDIIVMKKKAKKCTLWKLLYLEIVG